MLKVMQDLTLTPEQLAQRKARKQLLLLQGEVLHLIYLREMLGQLKIDKCQYVSHSKHSQQNGGNR